MEKKKVEIIIGKKVQGDVDSAKLIKGSVGPPGAGEISARWTGSHAMQCPWCGMINFVSDSEALYISCCHCSQHFTPHLSNLVC